MTAKIKQWYKPEQITITPQRMGFEFDESKIPDDWFYGNAFVTTWLETLSVLFPEGEQFFVDSVRHFRDQVSDKDIQKQISGFIGQEAMHSLEHKTLNDYMDRKGLPASELDVFVGNLLKLARKVFPERMQLSGTCALEHITAMLANIALADDDMRENFHESIRPLWMWHAIEETEHKGVAYDLYQHIGGTYFERALGLVLATVILGGVMAYWHPRMLYKSGKLFQIRKNLWGLNKIYGPRGVVTKLIPTWLTYFKPGFHPWDDDNSELVAQWKEFVLQYADPKYLKKAA